MNLPANEAHWESQYGPFEIRAECRAATWYAVVVDLKTGDRPLDQHPVGHNNADSVKKIAESYAEESIRNHGETKVFEAHWVQVP